MPGRAHRFIEHPIMRVITVKRPLRKRMPDTTVNGEELAVALPRWKRFIDLAMVTLLIPVWLPIMTFVALWVAVTSPGPIFYRQPRIGFKGRRFILIKFSHHEGECRDSRP